MNAKPTKKFAIQLRVPIKKNGTDKIQSALKWMHPMEIRIDTKVLRLSFFEWHSCMIIIYLHECTMYT